MYVHVHVNTNIRSIPSGIDSVCPVWQVHQFYFKYFIVISNAWRLFYIILQYKSFLKVIKFQISRHLSIP